MIKEKSCGAVVYKIEDDVIFILIEQMKKGHFSIPKGHVEGNETEEETALREIKEETNLDVALDTSFRHTITYSPYANCQKDVVFFTAKPVSDRLINQECEVSGLCWMTVKKAAETLTFESDIQTVLLAEKHIKKFESIL